MFVTVLVIQNKTDFGKGDSIWQKATAIDVKVKSMVGQIWLSGWVLPVCSDPH